MTQTESSFMNSILMIALIKYFETVAVRRFEIKTENIL